MMHSLASSAACDDAEAAIRQALDDAELAADVRLIRAAHDLLAEVAVAREALDA